MTGDGDGNGPGRQGGGEPFAPLHGAYAAPVQVVLPADVEELVLVPQSVQVEVEQGEPALVLVNDGEGWAGDPALPAESPREAPGKGGLPRPQAAGVGDDAPGLQPQGQGFAQPLGLLDRKSVV